MPRGKQGFQPGQSGNPAGMTSGKAVELRELRSLAITMAPKALKRLYALIDHEDPKVAALAADSVLDRAGLARVKSIELPAEQVASLTSMTPEQAEKMLEEQITRLQ